MFPRDRSDGFRGKKKLRSEAGRNGEGEKRWNSPWQGIASTFRGEIGRGGGGKGMVAARMQFFSICRKQRAVDKICIIPRRAVCRFVSVIYTVRRDYAPRERMVDLLDLFRSDYVDRKRKRKREREEDVWSLIPANKQPLLAL